MKEMGWKVLLSFVGINDAGELIGNNDGAILTALNNESFDEVILFWNDNKKAKPDFKEIANYLSKEIIRRKLAHKVNLIELKIPDVTDHNQIYIELKNFCESLEKSNHLSYTAAISSGTPAMQVCWILLAESGDFSESNPLNLIKVSDPKFGISKNVPVKIDTALPRIVRLKDEIDNLKKELLPVAKITISKPQLEIGETIIPLSPIELSYYRYFVERILEGKGGEKFSGFITPHYFLKRIIEIHQEFYPDLDSNRFELENIYKKNLGLSIYTFRGNISKINKKLRENLKVETLIKNFMIYSEGNRGAKFYGIKASADKFLLIK